MPAQLRRRLTSSLLLVVGTALADPAFYCEHKTLDEFDGYVDYDRYVACGDVCDCSLIELLCLVRNFDSGEFTFESVSFEYADTCTATECLCNIVEGWSDASRPATTDGQPLPDPLHIALPHYDDLVSYANSGDPADIYWVNLLSEISGTTNADRADSVVIHPINEGKPDPLPVIGYNEDVPTIASNCPAETFVTCELFYELDWSYKLSYRMACEDAETVDPCFGTYACFCDNDYFKLAENMPKLSTEDDTETELTET